MARPIERATNRRVVKRGATGNKIQESARAKGGFGCQLGGRGAIGERDRAILSSQEVLSRKPETLVVTARNGGVSVGPEVGGFL